MKMIQFQLFLTILLIQINASNALNAALLVPAGKINKLANRSKGISEAKASLMLMSNKQKQKIKETKKSIQDLKKQFEIIALTAKTEKTVNPHTPDTKPLASQLVADVNDETRTKEKEGIPVAEVETSVQSTSSHDVVVVGAGSAGMYAAKTLINSGYDVLIIEATDRIGGRVYSADLGDMRVELGAEEHYLATGNNPVYAALTGEYGNGVYAAMSTVGTAAYSMDNGVNTCWEKNNADKNCADDSDVVTFTDDFLDWTWKPNKHSNPNTNLAEDVLNEFGVDSNNRAYHLYDQGNAGYHYATSLQKIGGRSLALQDYQWDLSEEFKGIADKDLGFSDALSTVWWNDVLASPHCEILLNSPVVGIDTSQDDVVIITDGNGHLHAARQVIVTVSIGVLQAEMIDFIPDLPSGTVGAYNGIGFDMGMKVPIRFTHAWWETEGVQLSHVTTEGLANTCWVSSQYKSGTTSTILMCYPMGDNAAILNDMAAAATAAGDDGDEAIIQAVLADLDTTFPQALNQASANYIDGLVQNWGTHPYTLGVYSYPKVGTYTTASNSKRKDLQVPVMNKIFFAGEASHNTHAASVPGAVDEGKRAANAVISVNGNPNNPPDLGSGDSGDNGGGDNGGGDNTGDDFVELNFNDFESSLGIWNDGGGDAKHYQASTWASNGAGAMNIQRNGADATMTTDNLALAGKSEIKIDFNYVAKGVDANEFFQLQISTDGGNSFQLVQQWVRNVDFNNKQFSSDSVTITGVVLNNQTQLRFRCFADAANDDVFIDDVRILVK